MEWLFDSRGRGPLAPAVVQHPTSRREQNWAIRELSRGLPAGETQLVTVRLPQDLHTRLREWCDGRSFTMAAVIRGLIERFMDQQDGEHLAGSDK